MQSARALHLATALLVLAAPLAALPSVAGAEPPPDAPPEGRLAGVHDSPEDPDGNVTVLRGDGALVDELDGPGDVRRARANGELRPSGIVVPGDALVLQFESRVVDDAVAATEGTDATDRFFRTLAETDVNLSVVRRNHGVEQVASRLALNRSNVAVIRDAANATFSLVVDTGNVSLVARHDGEPVRQDLEHAEFEAVVEIPDDGGRRVLVGGGEFRGPAVDLESPTDALHLELYPPVLEPGATGHLRLRGRSTLLPGSNLTVRAVAPNGSVLASRRVRTAEVNASRDRFEHAALETSLTVGPRRPGDEFDLVVARGDEPLLTRRVVVGRPPRMTDVAAERVASGEHAGEVRVAATLRLPDDGFLVVYEDGDPVAVPVPEDETVRRELYVDESAIWDDGEVSVLAQWDVDGSGRFESDPDRLFRTHARGGSPDGVAGLDRSVPVDSPPTATRTRSPPSPSSPGTPTRAPTEPTTSRATDSPTPSGPPAHGSPGPATPTTVPGPGAVGALAAVAFAALAGTRWRADRPGR